MMVDSMAECLVECWDLKKDNRMDMIAVEWMVEMKAEMTVASMVRS